MHLLPRRIPGHRLASVTCATSLAFALPGPVRVDAEPAPAPALLVRIPDPAASSLVHRSLRGAVARLERSASCRAVLGDFTTPSGEPLGSPLEARGETPGRYLAGLLFLDGTAHPRCRSGAVAAYTAPGWRVVYVCADVFRQRLERKPSEAEAVLIHEALHTLGLGENPPTPRAIQDKVRARCVEELRASEPGRTP